MLTATAKGRSQDDLRPEEAHVVQLRRLSGVPDADHVHPRACSRSTGSTTQPSPAQLDQRLHAARPEKTTAVTDSRPTRSRSSKKYTTLVDNKHIFGFENVAPVVSKKSSSRAERGVARGNLQQRHVEAADRRRCGRWTRRHTRKEHAEADRVRVPQGEPARQVVKVVVLGGGSTGEHFVGALRRFDAEAQITLVESRLVGGECSYFACMPTKTMLRATEALAAARSSRGPPRLRRGDRCRPGVLARD